MKPKSNHKSIHHRTNKLFECTVAVHCFFSMRSANSTVGYRRLFFRIYTFFSSVWPVTASCMRVSVSMWLFVASSTHLHQHHALQTHLCLCASFSRPCNLSPPPPLWATVRGIQTILPHRGTSLSELANPHLYFHTHSFAFDHTQIFYGPVPSAEPPRQQPSGRGGHG